jgi:hypothetical protein
MDANKIRSNAPSIVEHVENLDLACSTIGDGLNRPPRLIACDPLSPCSELTVARVGGVYAGGRADPTSR